MQDQIKIFLARVDKYQALRKEMGKPLTDASLSLHIFNNSRRITMLRAGVDIFYFSLLDGMEELIRRHREDQAAFKLSMNER